MDDGSTCCCWILQRQCKPSTPSRGNGGAVVIASQRLVFLIETVELEAQHLLDTDGRLFAQAFNAKRAAALRSNIDESERTDAFVARFGRVSGAFRAIAGHSARTVLRTGGLDGSSVTPQRIAVTGSDRFDGLRGRHQSSVGTALPTLITRTRLTGDVFRHEFP